MSHRSAESTGLEAGTFPLAGVTILDLTHVLAGPYASMTLADLGARVIKVECPDLGDDTRAFPPFKDGQSAYFATMNHCKESIALDLKDAADRTFLNSFWNAVMCFLKPIARA